MWLPHLDHLNQNHATEKKKKKKKTKPQEGKSDMFRKRLECDRVFPHGIRNFFFDFKFSSELCNSQ